MTYALEGAIFVTGSAVQWLRDGLQIVGNAAETAAWVAHHKYRSLRLVTTDWHMRRAEAELSAALPPGVTIVRDAVPSRPRLGILFLEYNKLLASTLAHLLPDGK